MDNRINLNHCKTEVSVIVKVTVDVDACEHTIDYQLDLSDYNLIKTGDKITLTGTFNDMKSSKVKTKYHLKKMFQPHDQSKHDLIMAEIKEALEFLKKQK